MQSRNNPEEISVWQSGAALPPIFFLKFYFDLKMSKMVFKQRYHSISNQTKCLFTVLSALFCSSGCCPLILDHSLAVVDFRVYGQVFSSPFMWMQKRVQCTKSSNMYAGKWKLSIDRIIVLQMEYQWMQIKLLTQ